MAPLAVGNLVLFSDGTFSGSVLTEWNGQLVSMSDVVGIEWSVQRSHPYATVTLDFGTHRVVRAAGRSRATALGSAERRSSFVVPKLVVGKRRRRLRALFVGECL